ncbi:MAG: hypothetical protein ACREO8_10185 [Luteimonas sp.]
MTSQSNALEAIKRPVRVRIVRSVHQDHAPRVVVIVDPNNTGPAVDAIRKQVLQLKRNGAGSYLLIDTAMNVYVLSELRSITPAWVREHFAWLVAFYAPRRRDGSKKNADGTPFLTATHAGITEDVLEHIAGLSGVKVWP